MQMTFLFIDAKFLKKKKKKERKKKRKNEWTDINHTKND